MRDDLALTRRMDELYRRLTTVENQVVSASAPAFSDIVPALNNFLDNSDFLFSQEVYNPTLTFTDDEDTVAQWYVRTQATSSSWVENAVGAESSESITSSAHGSPSSGVRWNTTEGMLNLSGGFRVGGRIPAPYAKAGNYMICRMQMVRVDPEVINEDLIMKVSIWDNTNNEILYGEKPELTSTKTTAHSGGTVTRQYILEVLMPDGTTFYSDMSSFTTGQNQVINTVSAVDSSDDIVSVNWDTIIGASRYRIYRRTPSEADTNWYLIENVGGGRNSIQDFGGIGLGQTFTVPAFTAEKKEYQRAEGFVKDLGIEIPTFDDVYEILVSIRIPTGFVATGSGNQFLQIEFLTADYGNTDLTDMPEYSIKIDRLGLSYTNGRWNPSARDQTLLPAPIEVEPPPTGGGGGGNPSDPTCVRKDSEILVWDDNGHYTLRADEIVVGDKLVSWDGKKLAPSLVKKVVRGISTKNYTIITDTKELSCSFTHRVITGFDDFEHGTRVSDAKYVLTIEDDRVIRSKIIGIEAINSVEEVITFNQEKGKRNYIANGIFGHNLKPIDPNQF